MKKEMISKLSEKEFNRARYAKTALKADDEVIVISGRERGKRGKIMEIDRLRGRVIVKGLNKRKRFVRPTQENPQGGVVELESAIHISNVMFYDTKSKKGVRIGFEMKGDKKIRISRPGGNPI